MSKLTEVQARAAADVASLKFFRAHPELLPIDANRNLLESYIDSQLMDAGDPYCWEIANLAIHSQLAEVQPEEPADPAPVPTPADTSGHRVWQTEEILAASEGRGRHGVEMPAPKVLPRSIEIFNPEFQRTDEVDLNAQGIKRLDRRTYQKLVNTYGTQAINDRLQGRS